MAKNPTQGKALIKERKRKRKPGTATVITKDHPQGREAMAGHEDRLASFIKRTLELKRKGHYLHEIAEIIADEYNLAVVPHITTISAWRRQGMEAVNEDILELQMQLRIDQFNELERMKAKWMPIACADELQIQRWKMIEGELQPFMDENATAEQLKATKILVDIMNRQAKLMGLDMEKAVTPTGDGPESLQDLQLWMIQQLSMNAVAGKGGPVIDAKAEVLQLKSGIPEIDGNAV